METKSGSYSARWVPEVDTSIISIASKSVDYASNVILVLLSGSIDRSESQKIDLDRGYLVLRGESISQGRVSLGVLGLWHLHRVDLVPDASGALIGLFTDGRV